MAKGERGRQRDQRAKRERKEVEAAKAEGGMESREKGVVKTGTCVV